MNLAFAGVAFLVYVIACLALGERFLFSKYSMYARLSGRTVGAVPYIRAGSRWVEADEIVAVAGLDDSALDATGVPCSQLWLPAEARRCLRARQVAEADHSFVPIDVGFRFIEVTARGITDGHFVSRGQALAKLR